MYHDIAPEATSRSAADDWFTVSHTTFCHHLDVLRGAGFVVRPVGAVLGDGERHLAISFDDGLRSHYERAFPALVERDMKGTFYVVTDLVDRAGYVTWSELREMRDAGMSIQSHTRSHPFLSELGAKDLRDELVESKRALDDALGQDTDQLALPGGNAPRRRLRYLIAEAGYGVVATSRWGTNPVDGPGGVTFIRRCTVAGDPEDDYLRGVLRGDPGIFARRRLREAVLGGIRGAMGPSSYAAWRRRVLAVARALGGSG